MKELRELNTPQEVEERIREICRNMPADFLREAQSALLDVQRRAKNAKLNELCRALERKRELEAAFSAH